MPSSKKSDGSIVEIVDETLLSNKHINNMAIHDDNFRTRMRQMQAIYSVKHYHCSEKGYCFRIALLWDHDRLWGTFEFEYFKGIFLVDPGPGQDHFKADDELRHQDSRPESQPDIDIQYEPKSATVEYPLVWQGTSNVVPVRRNIRLNAGKIRFGFRDVSGHFDGMQGVKLQGDRCEFHGKQLAIDISVPFSVQDIIDAWNKFGILEEDESPRLCSGEDEVGADEKDSELDNKPFPSTATPQKSAGNSLELPTSEFKDARP